MQLNPRKNDVAESVRSKVVALLNSSLADCISTSSTACAPQPRSSMNLARSFCRSSRPSSRPRRRTPE